MEAASCDRADFGLENRLFQNMNQREDGMHDLKPAERLIIALNEVDSLDEAAVLVNRLLKLGIRMFKIGPRLFMSYGPSAIGGLRILGANVFLDMNFHATPSAVGYGVEGGCRYGIRMVSVHASGGIDMMRAAVSASSKYNTSVFAETMLTSLDSSTIKTLTGRPTTEAVLLLANWAVDAGVKGIICSSDELSHVKAVPRFTKLLTIVPGTRLDDTEVENQKHVLDAQMAAIAAGADYIVVGRAITRATDPVAAATSIIAEITAASPNH